MEWLKHVSKGMPYMPQNGPHICATCHRSFATDEALREHAKATRHYVKRRRCLQCDKLFCNQEALDQHTRDKHGNGLMAESIDTLFDSQLFDCKKIGADFFDKKLLENATMVFNNCLFSGVSCVDIDSYAHIKVIAPKFKNKGALYLPTTCTITVDTANTPFVRIVKNTLQKMYVITSAIDEDFSHLTNTFR